ncbi:ABC-type amino acid transport/signal transduction systems, periplasmic component/domain [Richelia intracellularis HH01]|uniref:ABC-type amino acid transport/signal transduction systems, periplasmic component/domain n=1 Tax=Richelia intracellularis HH01 TaxID=1165094 RepID=M1X3D7_9NOST|nr:transporter substrate-binding domain-containing protein [Richelia intracellularis]CCH68395.1 ABC-type amino acid transport/signal transduction systems, periplasmic component/domain [Richelia intracellularis HH01]
MISCGSQCLKSLLNQQDNVLSQLHLLISTAVILVLIVALLLMLIPDSATANELSEIQHRSYVRIAVKDNVRPLAFKDVKGNLQGLEIDLAQRLATDLLGKDANMKLVTMANRDRLPMIFNHKVDLVIARVTSTTSRSRIVSFSIPYYLDGTLLVTKDTSLERLQDLATRKIGVLNNSSTIASLKFYLPNAELVGVSSYKQGKELLENNTIAAFAADGSVLAGWVQEYPQYHLITTKLSTEPLSVVMPKGMQYDELRQKVNSALTNYISTGWLKQRIIHWGLPVY